MILLCNKTAEARGAFNRISGFMDEIMMQNRSRASVWGVALAAIALFVAVVLVVGIFGSAEVTAVAS